MKFEEFPTHSLTVSRERESRIRWGVVAILFLLSLWLRAAFPIFAIGPSGHDDALFVSMGTSISQGHWLGNYDNLTHAKGVMYPLFLVFNHLSGLPLKFTEHFIYLCSSLYFIQQATQFWNVPWVRVAGFGLLAFIPTAWHPMVGGRVVREGIYVSFTLLLLALAIYCYVRWDKEPIADETKRKRGALILLGVAAGCYWLTREEGVWLLPSLLVLLGYGLWKRRRYIYNIRQAATLFGLPIAAMAIVVLTINSINYFNYGVFRNNDFRSTDFQAGYGALARIKHDKWERYVVFPKDARDRAYRFSAAARELQPAFEGASGAFWRNAGCIQLHPTYCPEGILSGWFMWALRDAVAAAGYYRSAESAQAFYLRLAREIDIGCEQHPEECLPYRETLVPPWRFHYIKDTFDTARDVFQTLIVLDYVPVAVRASIGSPAQLAAFEFITNGPLADAQGNNTESKTGVAATRNVLRVRIATQFARLEQLASQYGISAALIGWLVWLILAIRRKQADPALVIACAMVAALATRIGLLAFLDATSIPSNNMLYLLPIVPIALALIPLVLLGLFNSLCAGRLRVMQSY